MSAPVAKYARLYRQIGVRIAQARGNANLTQGELAKAVGLSRPAIANMERGRQSILIHNLEAIANACAVQLGALIGETLTAKCGTCAVNRHGLKRAERRLATIAKIALARP